MMTIEKWSSIFIRNKTYKNIGVTELTRKDRSYIDIFLFQVNLERIYEGDSSICFIACVTLDKQGQWVEPETIACGATKLSLVRYLCRCLHGYLRSCPRREELLRVVRRCATTDVRTQCNLCAGVGSGRAPGARTSGLGWGCGAGAGSRHARTKG